MSDIMKILMVGDIVGEKGCNCFARKLPSLKREHRIDLVIVNCENATATSGIMPSQAQFLLDNGADLLTGGNHIFGKKQMHPFLNENPFVIRPANFPDKAPGKGKAHIDCGSAKVTVINLQGTVFMDSLESPFDMLDKLLDDKENGSIILVDFHAEASSEKRALGFYADGRVTALVGTHTHVQTADEQILPKGTGYITDLGMTGVTDSVLGADKELAITRFRNKMPIPLELAEGECTLNGVIIETDRQGKCLGITRVNI